MVTDSIEVQHVFEAAPADLESTCRHEAVDGEMRDDDVAQFVEGVAQ